MNIKKINKSIKILQKSSSDISTFGGGTVTGKYVRINSSISKNSQNNYTVHVSLSTSSSGVYNGYGIRVYAVIDGTSHHLGSPTISSGVFSTSSFSKSFSVSKNTSVYARCICAYCEDGNHTEDRDKFENSTSADTAIYDNPAIIPYAPNPTMTWGRDSNIPPSEVPVYSGTKSSNPNDWNYTSFDCGMPGGASYITLYLEKYNGSSWVSVNTHNITGTGQAYRYNYNANDRGVHFRLLSRSVSSTGHDAWGPTQNWRINDLPNMNDISITTNVSRTINNVTVNWARHFNDSYNDLSNNAGRWYRIHINKYIDNSWIEQGSFQTGNVLSANFNLSDYNIREGDLASIGIEPGDALEWSFGQYGLPQVRRNSAPYWKDGTTLNTQVDNSPYNKVFNNIIQVNFSAAVDNEGDSIEYKYSYRKKTPTGSWSDFIHIEIDKNPSKNIDVSNFVSRGDYIQIGVIANDLLQDSPRIISEILRRADFPPTVGPITINPVQSEEHYERISSISWNHVQTSTGANASKYKTEMIVCRTKNTNDVYSTSKLETSGTSVSYDITTVPRGYYIYFRVTAVDIFGLESLSPSESKWCRRNRAPIAPVTFRVSGDKLNFFNTVPLTWSAGNDPDSDAITYSISFSKDKGQWNQIASGLTSLTYTHNIQGFLPDTTLGYKIKTIDKYGIESSETVIDNCHNLVVNRKPNPPLLDYPILAVYDKNPRIMFRVPTDHNGDSLNVLVTMNGATLNSATSPNNFNKSSYLTENGLFMTSNLNVGNNTLVFKTFDGYEYSSENQIVITYKEPTLNPITDNQDVIISKDIYNKLIAMINDSRIAYGLSAFDFESVSSNISFVTANKFLSLLNKIYEVNEFINNSCSGLSRPKIKPPITRNNLIYRKIYNSILDIITNL